MSHELALRGTVAELVAAFEAAEREVRECFARLTEAERRLNAAFMTDGALSPIRIDASGGRYRTDFEAVDDAVGRMTREAWRSIIERLELRRVLSISRWEELQRQLAGRGPGAVQLPDITQDNVLQFAAQYMDDLPRILQESVAEVYDWLRPRQNDRVARLKTNPKFELGGRVIVSQVVERQWLKTDMFRVQYNSAQRLTALENVFTALDGAGQVNKRYRSDLQDAIESAPDGRGKTAYFGFRACANQNLHIEFRRPDLVARFNRVAGGRNLRSKS